MLDIMYNVLCIITFFIDEIFHGTTMRTHTDTHTNAYTFFPHKLLKLATLRIRRVVVRIKCL